MTLTDEEIDAMPAGYELDILVAECCMRIMFDKDAAMLTAKEQASKHGPKPHIYSIPFKEFEALYFPNGTITIEFYLHQYSTDIADSWPLVEKYRINIYSWSEDYTADATGPECFGKSAPYSQGATAPLAICRTALKCAMRELDQKAAPL